MTKLRQLTPLEVIFIGGERWNIYQHTGGLTLLDASGIPGFGLDNVRKHVEERLLKIPIFRWKLHQVPLGLDLPYWVEDENFDLDHHIRRIAVPSPGDSQALGELASYLYARHLDRNRPLWEMWFIEGLADGRYAILQKQHHCMMDGVGASKVGEILQELKPNAPPPHIDPSITHARAGEVPTRWRRSLNTASHLSGLPRRVAREMYAVVRSQLSQQLHSRGEHTKKAVVPVAPFNADIGSARGFVFGSLPLEDIKAVKNYFGVTVNDVILALVSGSFRNYLLALDALPEESLRTHIAVSLRTEEDDAFSNKVTTVSVTLATDLAEPGPRLHAIAADTDRVKKVAHSGTNRGIMEIIQLFPPLFVNAIMALTPADQFVKSSGANLMVSNVRGVPVPTFYAGARITATYPMSIITPGGGINITCVGCGGNIDFGVAIDPDLVPNPWLIIDGLRMSLKEYLAPIRKAPRRRSTVKPRTGKRKRTV